VTVLCAGCFLAGLALGVLAGWHRWRGGRHRSSIRMRG
jgi:hypothetical protein